MIAKNGNNARNSGRHFLKSLLNALGSLNGLGIAQRTSIIQSIRFRTGKKNLYIIRKGMNFSNRERNADNGFFITSASRPGFIDKFDGRIRDKLSKRLNKSSNGKLGNGILIFGSCIAGPIGKPAGGTGGWKLASEIISQGIFTFPHLKL